jgi:redox-sensing transcriptional repressor
MPSPKTIGRLSLYRRLLYSLVESGTENVHSHQLAALAEVTAAQVRRDLMAVGCPGTPRLGYNVRRLIGAIGGLLDAPKKQEVALVGIGNLGRAILAYFPGRRPNLEIVAAFDTDPAKVNRTLHGCRCYPVEKLHEVVRDKNLRVAIVAVPASEAQQIANLLVRAGVRGIVNFAPVPLHAPPHVYVDSMDMTMSLEKVAFFARRNTTNKARKQ